MSHAILLALSPVFFVITLGYAAGRFRIVDNREVGSLNALVMDFALPAGLFAATASAPRSQMMAAAPLFAVLGAVMLLVYFAWFVAVRAVLKESTANASLQALTVAFPNLAGVGLPLVSAVIGSGGAVLVAGSLATGSILITSLTLMLVEMSRSNESGAAGPGQISRALTRALTKPVVVAPALGIVLSLFELNLGAVVNACLVLIGHTAGGVALFLTGLILSAQSFRLNWRILCAVGMADAIRPLLMAAFVLNLPISPEAARTAILLGAVPSGFFGILFAVSYRLDFETMGSMVLASTGFSIVTMTIVIALLFPS